MGEPILIPEEIPVDADAIKACRAIEAAIVAQPMTGERKGYRVTCVSMGNPHCIVSSVEDVDGLISWRRSARFLSGIRTFSGAGQYGIYPRD